MKQPVRDQFEETFGQKAVWLARAPGRVNLIGEHVDYNDGFVLPMAIERETIALAAPSDVLSPAITVYSAYANETEQIDLQGKILPGQTGWMNYVRGVFARFIQLGFSIPPVNILIQTNVPIGSGLASSAALTVSIATLIETICGKTIGTIEKAQLCQTAEREFAGVPCGIMDQYICIHAQKDLLLQLDCKTLNHQSIGVEDSNVEFLIMDTQVRHRLGESPYLDRVEQCEKACRLLGIKSLREITVQELLSRQQTLDQQLFKRARHVVSEIKRTHDCVAAVQQQNWNLVGELMYQSHHSLRDDYEVSCDELDLLVELTNQRSPDSGVFGARMTGGGFGGCVLILVKQSCSEKLSSELANDYESATGITPTFFCTRPASGCESQQW